MLEGIIIVLFLIPIGVYYLLKFIVKGLIILILICTKRDIKPVSCANLDEVDSLDGISFEHYVAKLLQKNGYKQVRVTKASGDFGVDVIATKDKQKWVFQCKHYQSKLGVKPVQEVYGGLNKYKADVAVVITNSYFTPHAKELARDLSVILWDRDILANMIGEEAYQPTYQNQNDYTNETQNVENIPVTPNRFTRLEINQLTANVYVIGQSIPPGTYDFICVFGEGSISKYVDETTLLGANNFFQWVGSQHDYQARQCMGVVCKEGEYLHINGNVVVEIRRTQEVELDL